MGILLYAPTEPARFDIDMTMLCYSLLSSRLEFRESFFSEAVYFIFLDWILSITVGAFYICRALLNGIPLGSTMFGSNPDLDTG